VTLLDPDGTRTEVVAPVRVKSAPPKPPRPSKKPRAPRIPPPPRPLVPRDARWWTGAAVLTASLLLLAFAAHAAAFSAFQHYREQTIAYGELRTSLAKAETPVGQLASEDEMVAPGTPVTLVEVPAIGLNEVVREGSSGEVLRSGPGHRRDSVMPGQQGTSVILGRQTTYGGPFSQLYRLAPGDEITVTTGQGTSTYRVFGLRRAGDPMPPDLARGAGRLELQTADGVALFPSGVLHVDADLVSAPMQTPSRVLQYAALPADERAMGQDSGAWFIAFFAFVFFVAAGIGMWWLWTRWGRWHAWLVGIPALAALGLATADVVMNALPNLL
jgi:sortase A